MESRLNNEYFDIKSKKKWGSIFIELKSICNEKKTLVNTGSIENSSFFQKTLNNYHMDSKTNLSNKLTKIIQNQKLALNDNSSFSNRSNQNLTEQRSFKNIKPDHFYINQKLNKEYNFDVKSALLRKKELENNKQIKIGSKIEILTKSQRKIYNETPFPNQVKSQVFNAINLKFEDPGSSRINRLNKVTNISQYSSRRNTKAENSEIIDPNMNENLPNPEKCRLLEIKAIESEENKIYNN